MYKTSFKWTHMKNLSTKAYPSLTTTNYNYTLILLLLQPYIISDPPLDVLLCDPGCSSQRNSLEMQSVAFFTFSTHSLQLPFSQYNSEDEYQTKGAVTQQWTLAVRSAWRATRAVKMYMHTERTRYTHAVWSMLCVKWIFYKTGWVKSLIKGKFRLQIL